MDTTIGTTALETTTAPTQAAAIPQTPAREDRSLPIRDLIDLSIETVFGLKQVNEQQLTQLLGTLVRNKALTADESYTLRDQLQNLHHFETALESRIESLLLQRGLITETTIEEIRATDHGAYQTTI